jgi:hypothetical protein
MEWQKNVKLTRMRLSGIAYRLLFHSPSTSFME